MNADDTFFADIRAFMQSAAKEGITIVPCPRCGHLCKIAGPPNPDARLLKLATEESVKVNAAMCVNCAATQFLKDALQADYLFTMSEEGREKGARVLLAPRIQAQFADLMKSGNADAEPDELDWQLIVDNWDLPMPKVKRQRKRK